MNKATRIKFFHQLWLGIITLLCITVVMLAVDHFFDFVPNEVLWGPVYIGAIIGMLERRNSIEYWILEEFKEEALAAIEAIGFRHRCTDKDETLYQLKLRWRSVDFATLKKEGRWYALDAPQKFESSLDQYITPDMLYGARRKKWYRRPMAKYSAKSAGVSERG